ncbi:MAG: glycoside hydrolase [Acidobacteria bacterium]|nr:MAG: glycoside hydrolase [Acidobacteriota bacterium]
MLTQLCAARKPPRLVSVAVVLALTLAAAAQDEKSDPLARGFRNPPDSAKPRVWWHWMNGNITKEGIKLDLEWMQRVGIGGFQNFDAALNTPKLVDHRLVYMTPEWQDAFRYATELADRLGLEEAIAGSPGWSESGGPWVKPNQGMKKVVWSETRVEGGKPFSGVLPHPPTVSGPFQNVPLFDFLALISGQTPEAAPVFYADSAVVAYRAPESDVPVSALRPTITSSGGNLDLSVLTDGDLVKTTALPKAPAGQRAWIQYEFSAPETMRAVTLAFHDPAAAMANRFGAAPPVADLEASDDGQNFRKLADIPNDGAVEHTIAFSPASARFFRVNFTDKPPSGFRTMPFDVENPFGDFSAVKPGPNFQISELVLHPGARVSRFEEKAGFANLRSFDSFSTPPVAARDAIPKSDIVDLTSKLHPDGTLDWIPPAGHWVVLRFGCSLTGVTNHPASPEGTGLEVDKLSREYVREYMNTYLDNYRGAVGPLMGKRGLQYVINDSWEAGTANWTDNLITEFTRRRGYDPVPWLPVLAGRVIESAEASEGFLWDFRETLGDMLAEYHYDQITDILHQRGMGHYGESHEEGRAFIGDGMEVKRSNDVPMSAMWTQKPGVNKEQYGYDADIRESASVAHIYGQNLVAAESLTAASGAWAWSPATLKPTADKEMAMGLNRFVIHTSVHQPLVDKKPGLALGPFGQWFNRNETWAELAKPWVSYLARSSYLLQQGKFVADIAYFYGEDSNITAIYGDHFPDVPAGYNFDYVNADALIHKFSVAGPSLITPSGMSYRILALDPRSKQMSLPVLKKINELVEAGAIVVGAKPENTPSLADNQAEFHSLADKLWGAGIGASTGNGKVYGSQKLADVLETLNIGRDFEYEKPTPDTDILFVHRKLADGDLYFVDNRNDRDEAFDAAFRVQGKSAELWHPDTGQIEPASYQFADGRTRVPLRLEPWGTVFVVFRQAATASSRTVPTVLEEALRTVEGPWDVAFQPDRGAPPRITLDKLTSWHQNSDAGVKYFSGTASYTKTIQARAEWFKPRARLWIDLGTVKNLAEVSVNRKNLGIVWKAPYQVDATGALKPGTNRVEIKVTNGWANRIIGDRQPGVTKTYTFTSPKFYKADAPLQPSGLLGPVRVLRTRRKN